MNSKQIVKILQNAYEQRLPTSNILSLLNAYPKGISLQQLPFRMADGEERSVFHFCMENFPATFFLPLMSDKSIIRSIEDDSCKKEIIQKCLKDRSFCQEFLKELNQRQLSVGKYAVVVNDKSTVIDRFYQQVCWFLKEEGLEANCFLQDFLATKNNLGLSDFWKKELNRNLLPFRFWEASMLGDEAFTSFVKAASSEDVFHALLSKEDDVRQFISHFFIKEDFKSQIFPKLRDFINFNRDRFEDLFERIGLGELIFYHLQKNMKAFREWDDQLIRDFIEPWLETPLCSDLKNFIQAACVDSPNNPLFLKPLMPKESVGPDSLTETFPKYSLKGISLKDLVATSLIAQKMDEMTLNEWGLSSSLAKSFVDFLPMFQSLRQAFGVPEMDVSGLKLSPEGVKLLDNLSDHPQMEEFLVFLEKENLKEGVEVRKAPKMKI